MRFVTVLLLLVNHAFAHSLPRFDGTADRAHVAHLDVKTQALRGQVAPVQLHLTVSGIGIQRGEDGFDTVLVDGLTPLATAGAPELFATGTLLAVPPGYSAKLTVLQKQQREIADVWIRPAQPRSRCACAVPPLFAFNASLYDSKEVFPKDTVSLEPVGNLGTVPLVRVAIHPLQLDLGLGLLQVTTDLTLRVDFHREHVEAPAMLPRALYDLVRSQTANGNFLGAMGQATEGPAILWMVVADHLKATLAPFVRWKQEQGFEVTVTTVSEAGGTSETIKANLQQRYDAATTKPTFLLFVGSAVPTFMETTSGGATASDWRYSLLAGNDKIPDVFYGRFPAETGAELTAQLTRTIAYEKNLTAEAWRNKGTTIASKFGGSRYDAGPNDRGYAEQVEQILQKNGFTLVDHFYEGAKSATLDNISRAIAEGRSYLSYFGHGDGASWPSTRPKFSTPAIPKLRNTTTLPFIVDAACMNGSWLRPGKNFGKRWLSETNQRGENVGAVAFLGASVEVTWHPPAVMAVGIAQAQFAHALPSIGASVLGGQLHLIGKLGFGPDVLQNLQWFNLFGDPSLALQRP